MASHLSHILGYLPALEAERVVSLLKHLGLPVYHGHFDASWMWDLARRRLERSGKLYLPIPGLKIGRGRFVNVVTLEQLEEAVRRCA